MTFEDLLKVEGMSTGHYGINYTFPIGDKESVYLEQPVYEHAEITNFKGELSIPSLLKKIALMAYEKGLEDMKTTVSINVHKVLFKPF